MKSKIKFLVGDLYRLDFSDGKSYIGASLSGAKKRYLSHQRQARKGNSALVYVAWCDYGAPKLVVLIKDLNEKKLWVAEKNAIQKYNTYFPNGYNSQMGKIEAPGMLGKKQSLEARKKVSVANFGRSFSEEHKKNMSLGQRGRKHSMEHREKNRARHLGKKASDETKAKMSAVRKGKKHTEKSKELIRNYNIGRKMSKEANEKNRKAHLRENLSEETLKRMRRSAQVREAKKRESRICTLC